MSMDWKDRDGPGEGWDDDDWDDDAWESNASWPGDTLGDDDAWRGCGAVDDESWRGSAHAGEWPEWNAGPEYLMWKRRADDDE